MSRHVIHGAWYGDHLPSGEFCALVPHVNVITHLGVIELPVGEVFGPAFVRCTNVGRFRFAGQAHDTLDPACWEYDGRWVAYPPPCAGVSPVIYDNTGVLHRSDGSVGSQGYRYVNPQNQIISGDATYRIDLGGGRFLFEYTDLGGLLIGQAAYDGGGVQVWDGATLRQLELGDCRFIRANRAGDAVALAFTRPEGVVLIQTTMAELRALPPVVGLPAPSPIPTPVPVPVPPEEPPVSDDLNLFEAVKAERAKYPALLTEDQPAKILNAVAWNFNQSIGRQRVGLSVKPRGEHLWPSPQGPFVAYDILHDKDTNKLYGCFTGELKAIVNWGEEAYHGDPVGRPWLAPIKPDGVPAPAPVPVPNPPPAPPTPTPQPPAPPTKPLPSYHQFVDIEGPQIDAAYRQATGHGPSITDMFHNAYARLVERWTFRDIIHRIKNEPLQDGGHGGDLRG